MSCDTNLQIICPSRKKRASGDIFTYLMPDGMFRFGRILALGIPDLPINTELWSAKFLHLVWFYDLVSDTKNYTIDIPNTHKFIGSRIVNQKPWTMGYFEKVGHVSPSESRPPKVYLRETIDGSCYSIEGYPVDEVDGVLVDLAISSHLSIDDYLSRKLGFTAV